MRFAPLISDGFKRLMDHPAAARVGGVALVFGGVLGVVNVALWARQNWLTLSSGSSGLTFDYEWYLRLIQALASVSILAVCVGVFGMCAIFDRASAKQRRVALLGVGLVVASGVLFASSALYFALVQPDYGSFSGNSLIGLAGFASPFIVSAGFVILGVAALRNRALGAFRWLPLAIGIGIVLTPFFDMLFFWLFRPGSVGLDVVYVDGVPVDRQVLFDFLAPLVPDAATQVGLLVLGIVLFGARERGARIVAEERKLTEERNLAAARRLYDEAWVRGETAVLEELVSPEVVDEYHEEVGLEDFERNVAGLRRSFPDLRFVVEDQRAEGDEVATRWSFTGTDEGGVLWYPPSGKQATLSGIFIDRFEDGKLVAHRGESETQSLIAQLGHARRE